MNFWLHLHSFCGIFFRQIDPILQYITASISRFFTKKSKRYIFAQAKWFDEAINLDLKKTFFVTKLEVISK